MPEEKSEVDHELLKCQIEVDCFLEEVRQQKEEVFAIFGFDIVNSFEVFRGD